MGHCLNCGIDGHDRRVCKRAKSNFKFCNKCASYKRKENFGVSNRSTDGLDTLCKQCLKKRNNNYNALPINQITRKVRTLEIKFVVIMEYGGKCICCGEAELGFLTIDHLNNDGKKYRKNDFYCWLKKNNYPKNLGFAVSCYNCNSGRACNSGICPHLDSLEKNMAVLASGSRRQIYYKKYKRDLKTETIIHYGGKCACCGETEIGFLTIDHENNDAPKGLKKKSGLVFYSKLRKNGFPGSLGLRVLCWNCNAARYKNDNICPHILSPIGHLEQRLNTV